MLSLGVMIVPAAALAWLGWRFIEQDRALESQRDRERLEHAADTISTALERRLAGMLGQLPSLFSSPLTDDALVVRFTSTGVERHQGARLLYHPVVPTPQDPPPETFAAGEALEFQARDYAKAIAEFDRVALSKDPILQAGALVRLARNLHKANRTKEALAAYERLSRLGSVVFGDVPADLLGQYERCVLIEELGRTADLERAAAAIHSNLQRGRWAIDRDAWEYYSQEVGRWLKNSAPSSQTDLALTAAVEWLWGYWQGSGVTAPSGAVRSLWIRNRPVVVLWQSAGKEMTALAAEPRYLESHLRSAWEAHGVKVALADSEGHLVLGGSPRSGAPQAVRAAADTQLPWTLRITSSTAGLPQFAGRRRLLFAGFGIVGALVMLASYFTSRAIARELAVSRLQSDFVSAVSHEFRTPIASMRHLTDLLMRGGISVEDSRQRFYPALARETQRLHRLIESLLNFGRMEAGAMEYRFEPVDIVDLVESVVAEFRSEGSPDRHRIEITRDATAQTALADWELLGRAVWNLLDNAIKYSPAARPVRVEVFPEGNRVAIRVRDEGPGIDLAEQLAIFQKFVRGTASRTTNVKGAGIGLAMVHRIVQAHHGEVNVESEPGRGSAFTILLPPERQNGDTSSGS